MPEFSDVIPGTRISAGRVSLAGLQAAMASGALTSAALTGFYLQRIDRLNPALHAVITVNLDAPAEAAASDAARAGGGPRGPLEGIPVLVKDNIQVAGMPTTAGSPALLGRRAAGRVLRLPAARGGRGDHRQGEPVGVGELPVDPLDQRLVHARRPDRQPVRARPEPVRVELGVGGRVAAGLAPLAVGTETDGSIVSPASACGVVGIKPTNGLVSRRGIVPISPVQDTAGPMAVSVADAAALLSVLAAADPDDPVRPAATTIWPNGPGRTIRLTAFLDAAALEGARLGIWRDASVAGRAGHRAPCSTAAVARLRSLGAMVIDPVSCPTRRRSPSRSSPRCATSSSTGSTPTWPTSPSSRRGRRCPARWPS